MAARTRKGKCDGCDKSPRVLSRLESGHWVCRTCMRHLSPPKKDLANADTVTYLRNAGIPVPDRLTKAEARRLCNINFVRCYGPRISLDTPADEAERIARIIRLREQGTSISNDATLSELEAVERKSSEVRALHTKVVGVSHANSNGSSRQAIIEKCRAGESLRLVSEPHNVYDRYAIRLERSTGEQVGYLSADLTKEFSSKLEKGYTLLATIQAVTGDEGCRGVNLRIIIGEPGVDHRTIQEFMRRTS